MNQNQDKSSFNRIHDVFSSLSRNSVIQIEFHSVIHHRRNSIGICMDKPLSL